MFDFSFGKLIILFALCLIVLGPEKLPKLAAQLGRFAGQARAMARHFRAQLEQEIAAEDLKKELRSADEAIAKIAAQTAPLTGAVTEAQNAFNEQVSGMQAAADAATKPLDFDSSIALDNDLGNEPSNAVVNSKEAAPASATTAVDEPAASTKTTTVTPA
jgi:sec-independent protein translocase protein TatB